MRFILNTRKKAPSFRARQDAYVFVNMVLGQLGSIVLCAMLLWIFLPYVDAGLFASAVLIFIAVSFYLSFKSVQFSQLVFLFSMLGIEILMLITNPFQIDPNLLTVMFILIDMALLGIVYYFNVQYPTYLQES